MGVNIFALALFVLGASCILKTEASKENAPFQEIFKDLLGESDDAESFESEELSREDGDSLDLWSIESGEQGKPAFPSWPQGPFQARKKLFRPVQQPGRRHGGGPSSRPGKPKPHSNENSGSDESGENTGKGDFFGARPGPGNFFGPRPRPGDFFGPRPRPEDFFGPRPRPGFGFGHRKPGHGRRPCKKHSTTTPRPDETTTQNSRQTTTLGSESTTTNAQPVQSTVTSVTQLETTTQAAAV